MSPRLIPILLYHSVCDSPPDWIAPFVTSPDEFGRHLDIIDRLGCIPLTVSEMADRMRSGGPWPERPVVITIDDGFADTADVVAPALDARGFPATLYITTAALVGAGASTTHRLPPAAMLTWSDLRGVERLGIEIGAHTVTHRTLDVAPTRAAAAEIEGSKRRLEDALGHRVRSFAYPHGHYDLRVELVRLAGFDSACAVKNSLSSATDDPFALSRLTVMASTPAARLIQWLVGEGAPVCSSRPKLRTRAGRQYRRLAAWDRL